MYIKTFRFTVSNAATYADSRDKDSRWYQERLDELATPEQIDKKINKFLNVSIPDHEVVDIKITSVDAHYHNNGRSNTIDLIYTIMYK